MTELNKWTKVELSIEGERGAKPGAFIFHTAYGGFVPKELRELVHSHPLEENQRWKSFDLTPAQVIAAGKAFNAFLKKQQEKLGENAPEVVQLAKRLRCLKGLWKYYMKVTGRRGTDACQFHVVFGLSDPNKVKKTKAKK